MKVFLILACAIFAVNALSDIEEWGQFKKKHNKVYTDEEEEKLRFDIFLKNKQSIEEHNKRYAAGQETYYQGINQFSDLTAEEFVAMSTGANYFPFKKDGIFYDEIQDVPDEWDWRKKGVIGEVKSQKCGDCWAHATTGIMEAQYALKHGKYIYLSRQNLIDCTFVYGNGGCNGGTYPYTYHYLYDLGINSEADYPYDDGKNNYCRYNASRRVTRATDVFYIINHNEGTMKTAVATVGPLAVTISAEASLQHYTGGIYNDLNCSRKTYNHAVQIVGYGVEHGQAYWLVKNSWGTNWGDQGYVKMKRGRNMCGIANHPSWAVAE